VSQGSLACLVQPDLQAEKVYRGKRENRYFRSGVLLVEKLMKH
jgi:hypothetical protein